jgi:hypothetical protein
MTTQQTTTDQTTTQQAIDEISDRFERARSGARERASAAPADVNAGAVPERNPLIEQYVRLAAQLANGMTDGELQGGIEDMQQQLDLRDTLNELNTVRESLQRIIASHPESPAAAQARRVLSGLDASPLGP